MHLSLQSGQGNRYRMLNFTPFNKFFLIKKKIHTTIEHNFYEVDQIYKFHTNKKYLILYSIII